jgi:UDP-N-acetylglucosamine--N-acetylmuramyl-(pentapeptide) pyrophosphoryl-undecaprenol N-acetylglucosamine transferase
MRIFFSGGGTAGSVTPLLAIAEQLTEHELFFVGTKHGVERQLVQSMHYLVLPAGKFRRYFSLRNILDLILIPYAAVRALCLMLHYMPAVVVSAGGYVSVPLAWAAWWCNVPVVVHHQDIRMSLATRLMKPFAALVTNAREIGNPVRSLTVTTHDFKLDTAVPTVLIMGGGTGAQAINNLVSPKLTEFCNVIHVTGPGKTAAFSESVQRYQRFELLKENFAEALHKADLVVSRAGFGTITELAALGKAAVIIPIPRSHQEDNAKWLEDHQAAVMLLQDTLTAETFAQEIQQLLGNTTKLDQLRTNIGKLLPSQAAQHLAQLIQTFC